VIVDANILLYAIDASSPFHEQARDWLERALNGPTRVGFSWPTLTAFLRLSTHVRATSHPLIPAEAWAFIDDWLAAEPAWIPLPTSRHAEVLRQLTMDGDLRGNLVTDAHLAALAIEHGVAVCSADSDFARFEGVVWINPLRAE
jgi:toxin-antitoxin system PIN domain toxin